LNKLGGKIFFGAQVAGWLFILGSPVWAIDMSKIEKCDIRKTANGSRILVPNLPTEFWQPSGALRKVRDGLALTVERHMSILDASGEVKLNVGGQCRLAYDLWAETFLLIDSSISPSRQINIPGAQAADALLQCASIPLPEVPADRIKVITLVNPVDAEQEKATREWLATKGFGGSGGGVISRALGAVINLKTETAVSYDCKP
jgi:hypothetical protein